MTTTIELLDAAKAASGCVSDYRFAKQFGVSIQTVSNWRQKRSTLSDDHAAMIAGILGREPGEVMALCAAERAKEPDNRARWLRVAAVLAAIGLPPAHGGTLDNNALNPAKNKAQTDNYAKWREALAWLIFGDWLNLA